MNLLNQKPSWMTVAQATYGDFMMDNIMQIYFLLL